MLLNYKNCFMAVLPTYLVLIMVALISQRTEACSSRTISKPRPSTSSMSATPSAAATISLAQTTASTTTSTTTTTTTTPRPNITFPTYKCPATYDQWYCLNEATCFSVKIGESVMYNCECALGFMGPRCEYKELDGSYLPKRPRPIMLEKASIASGATCALVFMFFICLTLYLRHEQQNGFKSLDEDDEYCCDRGQREVDVLGFNCSAEESGCRYYCCDKPYCLASGAAGSEERGASNLRQYVETLPLSFAIKRTTKM